MISKAKLEAKTQLARAIECEGQAPRSLERKLAVDEQRVVGA